MKLKRKSFLVLPILSTLVCITLLFGCSNEPAKEYSNQLKTFTISVSGEWTSAPNTNENNITLDNEDQSLTITVQKFPKEFELVKQITSLDNFISFYEQSSIANLLNMGEVSDLEDVEIDSALAAKAYELKAKQNNVVAKAYFTYIETETGYYSTCITGLEKIYDKNISKLKEAIKTLEEIEEE